MREQVFTCDRCKVSRADYWDQQEFMVLTTMQRLNREEEEYDLCKICALEFKKWMKESK